MKNYETKDEADITRNLLFANSSFLHFWYYCSIYEHRKNEYRDSCWKYWNVAYVYERWQYFYCVVAIVCGIYCILFMVNKKSLCSKGIYYLRMMATVSEVIIFAIVVAVLMPMGMKFYSMIMLHAVVPLITAVSFVAFDSRPEKKENVDFVRQNPMLVTDMDKSEFDGDIYDK